MLRCPLVLLLVLMSFSLPKTAHAWDGPAIPETPVGKQLLWLHGVFHGDEIGDPTDRFEPEFREHLPAGLPEPVVASVLDMLRTSAFPGGKAELVEIRPGATETDLAAVFQNAAGDRFVLNLAVDEQTGKLTGLLLSPDTSIPASGLDSWEAIAEEIESLPGSTAVLVARVTDASEGTLEPIYQNNPDDRLAIGSAFKLWVLGGLAELVRDGEASWDEPLALNPRIRTMPLGELRTIAQRDGLGDTATFPLHQYADLMISISDNPATDHLIERVGRERIIAFMARAHAEPSVNTPFLTTGEFFKLKRGAPAEVLKAYVDAKTPEERAAVLDSQKFRTSAISIPMALAWGQDGPIAIDKVEWFASPKELAATLLELHRLEQEEGMEPLAHALRINDGINLADERWPSVAFKGGSEPGVINLSYLARHRSGEMYAVSLGWNNPEAMLDEDRFVRLAISVFALIDADIENREQPEATTGAE